MNKFLFKQPHFFSVEDWKPKLNDVDQYLLLEVGLAKDRDK